MGKIGVKAMAMIFSLILVFGSLNISIVAQSNSDVPEIEQSLKPLKLWYDKSEADSGNYTLQQPEGLSVNASVTAGDMQETQRQKLSFNREWKFMREDNPGRNSGLSGLVDNFPDAYRVDYDDSQWWNVGLPHDFGMPYWQATSHYIGYGWYRKTFDVDAEWIGDRISLDFEGVFHTAILYVNGIKVGEHEGGYTGFNFDITDYVTAGENTVAIRVDNRWKADLAPRGGEHQFSGGIYRDVSLIITNPVHVAWYGAFAQTPDLEQDYTSQQKGKVRMLTEVENNSAVAQTVKVINTVYDAGGIEAIKIEPTARGLAAGEAYEFDATSALIDNPRLWSPDDPYLYKVVTEIFVGGALVDQYENTLGFRWMKWTGDQGFFLNGEHIWLDGVNAHQDQAGWVNAITREAIFRDAKMIKDAGLNFIRGSHYPHSVAYSEACDELGILFMSEGAFWGMGTGDNNGTYRGTGTSSDYSCGSYPGPGYEQYEAAFEQSCLDMMTEMIRTNRNHPSIILWSMGNEVFFPFPGQSGFNQAKDDKKKALARKMGALAKQLDPTRATTLGGAQRGGYDMLRPEIDIAGYNGDGARIAEYINPGFPNIVAEYGSKTANRPGEYAPDYRGDLQHNSANHPALPLMPIEYEWRSGIALWCAFHHGSIAARTYGDMGFIDYYRLPLNAWHWYRDSRNWHYTLGNQGAMPARDPSTYSRTGTPMKLSLAASQTTIKNDGTDDAHIIVTVQDAAGNWLNNSPSVTLEVMGGPGVFPTGKRIVFGTSGDPIIRDGKAAIAFRSYYAGVTTIRATSSTNLEPAYITITTTGGPSEIEPGIDTMYGTFMGGTGPVKNPVGEPELFRYIGIAGNANASSGLDSRTNVFDGNRDTAWTAETAGSNQWLYYEAEHTDLYAYKARIIFNGKVYPYKLSYLNPDESPGTNAWRTLAEYDRGAVPTRPFEESLSGARVKYVRIDFPDVPAGEFVSLAEIEFYGIRDLGYTVGSRYLSNLDWESATSSGGGARKDASVNGSPIRVGGNAYAKGLGVQAASEIVFDLDDKAPGYSRFQCMVGIDGAVTAVPNAAVRIYGDGELLYQNTFTTAGASDAVDISVNGVSELKLSVTGSGTAANNRVDWADAKLIGAIRDISIPGSGYDVQYFEETQTLIAGQEYHAQVALERKVAVNDQLAAALTLYTNDGDVVSSEMKKTTAYAGVKTLLNMSVFVPADLPVGSYAKFVVWGTENLIPIAQTVTASRIDGSTVPTSNVNALASSALAASQTLADVFWANDVTNNQGSGGNISSHNGGTMQNYSPDTIGLFFPSTQGNITVQRINGLDNQGGTQWAGSLSFSADAAKAGVHTLYVLCFGGAETQRMYEATVNGASQGNTPALSASDVLYSNAAAGSALRVVQKEILLNAGNNVIKLQAPSSFAAPNFVAAAVVSSGPNFSALLDAIEQCQGYKAEDYSEGWAAFASALENAIAVCDNENAEQSEIDGALTVLINTVNALVINRDETLLKAAIRDALEIIYPGDADKYEVWRRLGFTDVLFDGHLALADKQLVQSVIDPAVFEIREAIKRLTYQEQFITFTDGNGNPINALISGTVKVSLRYPNQSGRVENLKMYVAVYSPDGRLSSLVVTEPKSFSVSQPVEFEATLDLSGNLTGYKANVFLWDSSYVPVMEKHVFPE
jgi:hypothetical protein